MRSTAPALNSGCPCHARATSPTANASTNAVDDDARSVAPGGSDVTQSPWDSMTRIRLSPSEAADAGGNIAAATRKIVALEHGVLALERLASQHEGAAGVGTGGAAQGLREELMPEARREDSHARMFLDDVFQESAQVGVSTRARRCSRGGCRSRRGRRTLAGRRPRGARRSSTRSAPCGDGDGT